VRNLEGIDFGTFKSGKLHDTHAVATWNVVTHLCVCLKTGEKQENLCRDGGRKSS